jgi:alkanesulfonate monooxygenase SsuD/methylene tetrahydromethanopterin reductase-like flavin-dependent oxidoreductase (luciferase family)
MGRKKITPHDQRYEEAHEYMDLMYSSVFSSHPKLNSNKSRLWEGSWEDGAQIWDPETGAYDPNKIHKITFNGKYHSTSAYQQTHPSPQRTPVLFQAGSSKAGKAFGAKHAEALFIGGRTPAGVAPFVKEMRAAAAAEGRDPSELKFFPMITPIIGKTLEEAQAKRKELEKYADYRGGLVKVSTFLNTDLSKYPLDEPFEIDGADASIHTMLEALKAVSPSGQRLTPRQLGAEFAFCGFGDMPTGTPDMIADRIEEWANVGDIDGFNLACKPILSKPTVIRNQLTELSTQTCPIQDRTKTLSSIWSQFSRSGV